MDLSRPYRSRSLEAKRVKQLAVASAEPAMRAAKQRRNDPAAQVLDGIEGRKNGPISEHIIALAASGKKCERAQRFAPFAQLLRLLIAKRARLLEDAPIITALHAVSRSLRDRVRDPEDWHVASHNAGRQFHSLLRHLFARYPMPRFFDSVWLAGDGREARVWQRWYVRVAQGEALRSMSDLPFSLTKRMQHHVMQAPDNLTMPQALRWGQAVGLGCTTRLADAIVASLLGSSCRTRPSGQRSCSSSAPT